jgi:hypothetical protein
MHGTLTKEKIEQLSPDQASLSAALKLIKPAKWPTLGFDSANGLLWGECQGSGSTPYRVSVSAADLGYKCTCPSRKFPCKHVLALMWQRCDYPQRFTESAAPDWVSDWAGRRRGKSPAAETKQQAAAGGGAGRGASISQALAEAPVETAPDPKAAARAEAQSKRLREAREASVLEGVANLELWIADQLNHGLAGFAASARQNCRGVASRLVDAKAGGLAGMLDQLAADVFRVPDAQRAGLVMERLAALTLLASAYRRQDALPPDLREDVRRAVGWSVKRGELLADPNALRVRAPWLVIAVRSEVQPDRLRRLESWLMRLKAQPGGPGADAGEQAPRFALLLDFFPVADKLGAPPFAPGELLRAELTFYPSAAPLRAQISAQEAARQSAPASRTSQTEQALWPEFPAGAGPALEAYERVLALLPWLEAWPVAASGLRMAQDGAGGLLVAGEDGAALPLKAAQTDFATPLLAFESFSAADTPIGLWRDR